MGMVSIADLSRLSGVSVATVSRALNGYPDVSPTTRKRIQELAKETGYTPSEAARTLVRGRSMLVGVSWSPDHSGEFPHPFLHELLDALRAELGRRGYDVLLLSTPPEEDVHEESLLRRARQMKLAGVIVMGVCREEAPVTSLVASDVPTVVFDAILPGPKTCRITSDNVGGGALAARHLVETGRTRLAVITGPLHLTVAKERLQGFLDEAARLGHPVAPDRILEAGFVLEEGEQAMGDLLARPERPDGVFAVADLAAIGASIAARDAGVRVPEDIAVVGFDDVRQAAYVRPSLTTIRQDVRAMGTAAATAILALGESDAESSTVVLPTSLVVRESTAVPVRA